MPSLQTNPDNLTLSGFSAGGIKTSYIFNQRPSLFKGVGILSGSLGNLVKGKIGRVTGLSSKGWISKRAYYVKKGKLPPAKEFKGKLVYTQAGQADGTVLATETL